VNALQAAFGAAAPGSGRAAGPRGVLRVLQVLEQLGDAGRGHSLSELARRLGVPKTSLLSMLRVMQDGGYLVHDGQAYRLGPGSVALGQRMVAASRHSMPDFALPVLQGLARRTGETGFLAVLSVDRRNCRYVGVVETENWLRFTVQLGSEKPSYATGTGQAMLAWLEPEELQAALAGARLSKVTPTTVSSRAALMQALARVRERGVSTVEGGTVRGVTSVAAPIFGADGRVVAAISVGGPSERIGSHLKDVERAVRLAGQEISELLGYRG